MIIDKIFLNYTSRLNIQVVILHMERFEKTLSILNQSDDKKSCRAKLIYQSLTTFRKKEM